MAFRRQDNERREEAEEVQLIEFDFIIVSGHRGEVIDLWSYLDWMDFGLKAFSKEKL